MRIRLGIALLIAALAVASLCAPAGATVNAPGVGNAPAPQVINQYFIIQSPAPSPAIERGTDWAVGALSVAVGVLTLLFAILTAFGALSLNNWRKLRKELEATRLAAEAQRDEARCELEGFKEKSQKLLADTRQQADDLSAQIGSLNIKTQPSAEDKIKLDELVNRLDALEKAGQTLTADDYLNRATESFYDERYEDALRDIEKAIRLQPDDARVWYNKGVVLAELGRYMEALNANEKALHLKPNDFEALHNKGAVLERLERYGEALAVYDDALHLNPEIADTWFNKGVALGKMGRQEEALLAYEKAVSLKSDHDLAMVGKGIALVNMRRYDEALSAYNEAIRLKPDYALTWNNKGVALVHLGRYDEALTVFTEVIRLKPDDAEAWYNKACAHSLLGQRGEALKALKRAIELDAKLKENARTEECFASLREDAEFRALVGLT
jgi:tetratricopeptide (TPR) repeat protein